MRLLNARYETLRMTSIWRSDDGWTSEFSAEWPTLLATTMRICEVIINQWPEGRESFSIPIPSSIHLLYCRVPSVDFLIILKSRHNRTRCYHVQSAGTILGTEDENLSITYVSSYFYNVPKRTVRLLVPQQITSRWWCPQSPNYFMTKYEIPTCWQIRKCPPFDPPVSAFRKGILVHTSHADDWYYVLTSRPERPKNSSSIAGRGEVHYVGLS